MDERPRERDPERESLEGYNEEPVVVLSLTLDVYGNCPRVGTPLDGETGPRARYGRREGVRQRSCGSVSVCRADMRHGDGGGRGYCGQRRGLLFWSCTADFESAVSATQLKMSSKRTFTHELTGLVSLDNERGYSLSVAS